MATETTLVTIPEEGLRLIEFASSFLGTASAVRITNQDEAQDAVNQTKEIKVCAGKLDEYRKGLTKPLDEQKKAIMDAFRPAVEVLEKAEQLLKGVIGTWDAEQRRLAAEEEKKRRVAEAEERARQEKEQADAAALLEQADAAALLEQADAAALLEQADAAAARGDLAAAEALEAQAAQVQEVAAPLPVAVTYAPARPRGASTRTIWKCKVVDPSKLDRAYLMPNQAVLDALAATAKGVGAAPAGCEWTSTDSVSIR